MKRIAIIDVGIGNPIPNCRLARVREEGLPWLNDVFEPGKSSKVIFRGDEQYTTPHRFALALGDYAKKTGHPNLGLLRFGISSRELSIYRGIEKVPDFRKMAKKEGWVKALAISNLDFFRGLLDHIRVDIEQLFWNMEDGQLLINCSYYPIVKMAGLLFDQDEKISPYVNHPRFGGFSLEKNGGAIHVAGKIGF